MRFLDATRRGTIAQIQANAAEYYSFLAPAPGLRLLDVGSGTGTLLAPLAPLLLPRGNIIGIDLSAVMVEEASRQSREQDLQIQFQVGDVPYLEFPDASFDRGTANQVFVHLDDPGQALREMARATRKDGLVAVWEADWETMMLDASEPRVTRRIMNFFCDNLPQGWIGRMLPRLFAAAGLTDINVQPETVLLPGPVWNDQQYGFGRLPEFAEAAGIITSAERLDWQVNVDGRIRDGGPFVAFTAFRVVGRRPS